MTQPVGPTDQAGRPQDARPSRRRARWAAAFALAALVVGLVMFARRTEGDGTRVAASGAAPSSSECGSAITSSTSECNISPSTTPPPKNVPRNVLASKPGTFSGYSYVAYVTASGSVAISLTTPSGDPYGRESNIAALAALDTPFPAMVVFNERFGVVYGRAPTLAARVHVDVDSGDSVEGPVEPVAGQPFGMFAINIELQHPERRPDPNAGNPPVGTFTAHFLTSDGTEMAQQKFAYTDTGR